MNLIHTSMRMLPEKIKKSKEEKMDWKRNQSVNDHIHNHHYQYSLFAKIIRITLLCGVFLFLPCLILYQSIICHLQLFPKPFCSSIMSLNGEKSSSHDYGTCDKQCINNNTTDEKLSSSEKYKLERVLRKAASNDKTVIITIVNSQWAKPNSTFDIFLQSFRDGIHTSRLVNHLVVIALDPKAYARCQALHKHCFAHNIHEDDYSSEAYFMSPAYLMIVWKNIDLLCAVLDTGYNFIYTDVDILWFRNPFPRLHKDADIQISSDSFKGNSLDSNSIPNLGFQYVRSNNRSIKFYKLLYTSKERNPGLRITEVFNRIKHDPFLENIGLTVRFLDTAYFGGLCEPSKDLRVVCTMHANCCPGLENKIHDLKIILKDWRKFKWHIKDPNVSSSSWTVPQECEQYPYM